MKIFIDVLGYISIDFYTV